MEKEMFVMGTFKKGANKLEKFMSWMKSDEGLSVRKTIGVLEKTRPAISPDKSYVIFKVAVHNEDNMRTFLRKENPIAKPILDDSFDSLELWETKKVKF